MKKKGNEFRSINDLKNKFFPGDKPLVVIEKNNASDLGIELSRKALEKIKIKISGL